VDFGDTAQRDFDAALLADDAEALYDRAPCAYLSTTPDGVVVKVNQTFLTWTGLARDEVVGRRRFADLLGAGGRIYHETHFAPMLRLQGSVREMALDVVRADGGRFPVVVNAVLESGPDGVPLVVRIAMFDATERRQYERELVLARRTAEEAESRAVALARTLQQTLIPPHPPRIPGLEVAAAYRPAGDGAEVGGDFYDVFQAGDDEWVVVLGDVSGKGVDAAVVTSLIRYTARGIAARVADPSEVLRELNEVLLAHDTDRFCTLALLRLAPREPGWQVAASFGGHAPALVRRPDGSVSALGSSGSLVGVFDDVAFTTSRLVLAPGDTLVLHTDGVTDAANEGGHFGEERTLARVAALGPDPVSLTRDLVAEVVAFQHGLPRDDIAVLAVTVPSEPPGA
jgi:sigma-B regulation protein RsbU (phosphoserine phosphatase)